MKEKEETFQLPLLDALCAVRALEEKGAPEADTIREAIRQAAVGARQEPVFQSLLKVAEKTAAGEFLFQFSIEDVVLDALALMIQASGREPMDLWLKDSAIRVLAGIHVTSEGAEFESRGQNRGSAWVYGAVLADWTASAVKGKALKEGLAGILAAEEEGFFLRLSPTELLEDDDGSHRSLKICLYEKDGQDAQKAIKRVLGERSLSMNEKAGGAEVPASAGDAMEILAFSQNRGMLELENSGRGMFFLIKPGIEEAGFCRGWMNSDSNGLPVGAGNRAQCMIELPKEIMGVILEALFFIHLPEQDLVSLLLAAQA